MKYLLLLILSLMAVTSAASLTTGARAVIWTRCWETVRQHFTGFDDQEFAEWESSFDTNLRELTAAGSDVEFWRQLRMRVASLNDGNTLVRPPNGLPRVYDMVAIRFIIAEGKVFVKRLGQSSEVQNSGIRVGDELVSVDHVPVMEHVLNECLPHVSGSTEKGRLAEAAWRVLIGEADSPAHMVLRRPDGQEYSVSLKRNSGLDGKYSRDLADIEGNPVRKLRGQVLYVEIGQRFTANTEQIILDLLAENPKTKHLILDLRDTKFGPVPLRVLNKLALFPLPLGANREVDWTTQKSKTDPVVLESVRKMRELRSDVIESSQDPYRGGIAILVNAGTAGPAEQFLEPLVFSERATLIGDTTAGAGGQVIEVPFESGARLSVTVREPAWEDGRGAGRGFPPRIYVVPTAEGLASGKNEILERALVFIREHAN